MNAIDDNSIVRLKQVLEAAAIAPGNRERFLAAGLILDTTSNTKTRLSPDWQNSFLRLRPIDKQTIRSNPGLFLANVDDVVYRGTTSGSRGQFFVYFAGKEWNQMRCVARRRSLAWWGIDDNTPIINVASRMQPVRSVDMAIAGTADQVIELLLSLSQRPVVIRGYPSRLCEIASLQQQFPPALAVICTGECLFDYQRTLLEKVCLAPVINEYGCQETGISGLTCPEFGRLHLDSDRCLYEIIDGQLVTTDLYNQVMPLVRYKCGDVIHLDSSGCACGRTGLTGKILGRIEDTILTVDGIKHPGEIVMPSMNGICNYQVMRQGKNVTVQVLVDRAIASTVLHPLRTWINTTFGKVNSKIIFSSNHTPEAEPRNPRSQAVPGNKKHQAEPGSKITSDYTVCDDAIWIHAITKESWQLLQKPVLPNHAIKAAQLLKQLVQPTVIVNYGIPPTTLTLLDELLDLPPFQQPEIELITARILLFSCSFLADNPQFVTSIYNRAAERLENVLNKIESKNNSAIIDLLIPSLFLDTDVAKAVWNKRELLECQLDTFNVHHLLCAFEPAVRRAAVKAKNMVALKPLLSVLIGDLNFFAPRFGNWLLAHWCELIHAQPIIQHHKLEAPLDNFSTAWLKHRQMICNGESSVDALSALQLAAKTSAEKARVDIEQGYSILLRKQELDPEEWLKILQASAGVDDRSLSSNDIDLIAWLPIVRSLCVPLLAINPEMAYECLVISATPSSRISAFERIAFQNDKQSVICDLST